MNTPDLSFSTAAPAEAAIDVVVVGARRDSDGPTLVADSAYQGVADAFDALGVTGAKDQLVRLVDTIGAARTIAVIGLGPSDDVDALREAAGSAARQLAGSARIGFAFGSSTVETAAAIAEGAALGAYAYTEFKGASLSTAKKPVDSVTVYGSSTPTEAVIARVAAVSEAVRTVRDLVNMPPAELFPQSFADFAAESSAGLPLEITVWDEDELAEQGFGGILGVGKGSTRPPRLVKVSYSPAGAGRHVAIVGKGITFDSGGLSLKPMTGMIGMKSDMTGAAVALAVTVAAARLEIPVRLSAWLCLAENLPSGAAMRPNDVLRIRGGRTVEVVNTDAEGRLVLADGIVAASEEKPDAIVDVATLTGAQVVALGHRYSGLMGDEGLTTEVLDAAEAEGELFWAMPLPEELLARLDSDVADLKNATPGDAAAGMLLAGTFLREFVGSDDDGDTIPWAHLDIAGAALNEGKPYGYRGAGATGVAVRTLIRLAESQGRA